MLPSRLRIRTPHRLAVLAWLLSELAAPAAMSAVSAQDTVAVSVRLTGEMRVRGEFDDRTAGSDPDGAVLLRTRLGAVAAIGSRAGAFIEISDSRAFGEETDPLTDADADRLDVHQAYIDWTPDARWRARAGRQELAFADERLVGPVGWANVNRAFDGIRVTHRHAGWSADAFAATIRERDALLATGLDPRNNQGSDDDQTFFGLWVTRAGWDAFWLFDRNGTIAGATDVDRHTFGGYYRGSLGPLAVQATAGVQVGDLVSTDPAAPPDQTIRAFLASLRIGQAFPGPLHPDAALQVDYLSGDDDPTDDESRAFHTVFATNHPFYGHMDLFLDIPAQTGGRGLVDLIAKGSARAGAWTFRGDLHRFLLARADAAGETGIGSELDLSAGRALAPGLELVVGYSVFLPSDAGEAPAVGLGDETLHWAYVQGTARF